ncbi:hypothetical protein FRC10_001666 [Ceratobasidium sp. 414]|nr:hypothetical protein FRC10_001666 [Ceratobasidium sp. 414]
MAPILSPKLLNQILMHGYASVLAEPEQFPLPLKFIVRPTLTANHRKAIAAAMSRKTITLGSSPTKAAFALLPNCTFVHKHTDADSDSDSDAHVHHFVSSAICNSVTSGSLSEVRTDTLSAASTTCSESTSARSSTSIDSPSTDATSLPPWCLPRSADVKLGATPARVPRYIRTLPPPVDSLRIARTRRENETANMSSGSMFISRPRKRGATGLKGLGLRIIKRVKQW